MIKSLNKKWKEFLYGFAGFGPNFLMILMGSYFTDAINPAALGINNSYQAIMQGTCYILPALFPILYALAKIFDGIIDVPLAHITDTLSTKWGRRRPAILVCLFPMIISFACCWLPIFGAENQLLNTIWIFFWMVIFFATYTMSLIAYYGSLSTTCCDEAQRLRVSGYKSFFDTISYCVVYALVPILLDAMHIHIDKFVFLSLPLMLTMIIPLFLIKEGEKYGYPENEGLVAEKVTFKESLKLTFKNKLFMRWVLINSFTFIGLQMFLVAMNAMIIGGMGFDGMGMAILNTCAFAPVPVMLYLFNKLKAKKGTRFTYQTCLICFAISIFSFFFASKFVLGDDNVMLQYIIGCVGGVFGSWSIGAFFMMPYLVPAQISSVEEKLTGKNHSAMYFAAQALISSIASAISGSLIYELLKMLFISKGASGMVWAESYEQAAAKFGVDATQVFNFGSLIVPFIVSVICIIAFIWAFKLPKNFSPDLVAKELKKSDPTLDISAVEAGAYETKEEKGEILFVQIGLWVLSGCLFGFIWLAFLFKSVKAFGAKFSSVLAWICSSVIPFASIPFVIKTYGALEAKAKETGAKMVGNKIVAIILAVIIPVLPMNIFLLALTQRNINAIYAKEENNQIAVETEAVPA